MANVTSPSGVTVGAVVRGRPVWVEAVSDTAWVVHVPTAEVFVAVSGGVFRVAVSSTIVWAEAAWSAVADCLPL